MSKKNRTAQVAPVAEVAPAPVTAAPVAEAPAPVEAAPEAAAKKRRYAPHAAIANLDLVVGEVLPNPKRAGSKAADRYARFMQPGITVRAFIQAYKDANLSGMAARGDLRWNLEHGFITLVDPKAE